ncbi:aldehyde dehydrogenase family protein [Bailinhaonella thermotolerans]|uniref:aldehyde dehydrogenase family protein n=1 Tax=Bailinhaonella thermotolerans TaxID=1070861 RepID=UPI001F5C0025|nr:aldehyde dehydrogenase family protein [Bailinhaonella thermotolerans]
MRARDRWVFVDGAWRACKGGGTRVVEDPSGAGAVGEAPLGDEKDVHDAVEAARAAFPAWARTAPAERGAALRAMAARVRERADELARLVTREMGKPYGDALGGVEAGAGTLEQYAELGPVHRGRSLQGAWDAADLMVLEPRGVVGVITPWNDPVAIACGLAGAALVTGNTVVHKPSERTPHTGALLVEIVAGELPPGVLNLVTGDGRAGEALAGHEDLDVIAHVGSTAAGRRIAAAAARTGAKALLENGGKDPLIVDAGVDPEWAAEQAAIGCFANAGQICTSVERIYVHEDVAGPFTEALVRRARALRRGPGLGEGVELGPLVDRAQRDAVHRHVTGAVSAGARLLTGGEIPEGDGAFYPATVLTDCSDEMELMSEETFGPVAPIRVVRSFDEALAAAARSPYGLAAVVLTPSMANAQRAWRELPVGTVKVNAVFGGAPGGAAEPLRGSGRGFGYGPELLDEMTHTKVVHLSPPR